MGKFREQERDKPINALGSYVTRAGQEDTFQNAQELANFLASSDDAHRAFVSRAFQHFVKQPVAAYGPDQLDELTKKFRESGFNVRNLLVEIAVVATMDTKTDQPAG